MNIKDLIKGNTVHFDSFRQGVFYYNLHVDTGQTMEEVSKTDRSYSVFSVYEKYQFQVPIEDIGDATIMTRDKAITFMRWIRKSISDGTFIKQPNSPHTKNFSITAK